MIKTDVEVKWLPGAQKKLRNQPNKVLYTVASITLDMAYPNIPKSTGYNSGKLRQTSKERGVQGSNGNYYIGSYTSYAKYVYGMKDSTNWSTPNTNAQWYARTFRNKGKQITKIAIEREKLK